MEFVSHRAIEVTQLALDGLSARHKALSANIANAQTPNYQRSDVKFEDQLQQIIKNDDIAKSFIANGNVGLQYTPGSIQNIETMQNTPLSGKLNALSSNYDESFSPQVYRDNAPPMSNNGNNVNLEKEMIEQMKVATKYNTLATLEGKMIKGMQELIKGIQ